jgi:hypothetical protein
VTHPFDERWVALPTDDLFVDLARLLRIHRLTSDHLAVDRQLEVLERSALRHRKEVIRLADRGAAIHEAFVDLVPQHAVDQLDTDIAPRANDVRRPDDAGLGQRTIGPRPRRSAARDDPTLRRRGSRQQKYSNGG